jgi:hypothetical protein
MKNKLINNVSKWVLRLILTRSGWKQIDTNKWERVEKTGDHTHLKHATFFGALSLVFGKRWNDIDLTF